MIELGSKVRDKVSGLEGTVMYRIEYLNGCVQYNVQPKMKKGSTEIPSWNIDEAQLINLSKPIKVKKEKNGGRMMKVDNKGI